MGLRGGQGFQGKDDAVHPDAITQACYNEFVKLREALKKIRDNTKANGCITGYLHKIAVDALK
jgi:hypothetical protein